jgi:regulator of replication initiation timing
METTTENKDSIIRDLVNENRKLKKENKELTTHNTFLTERLDSWADKNFTLRTENEKLKQDQPEFAKQ